VFQPKVIGIIAFDGVTASHLATLFDVFTAAALQDGFGGSIACYRVRLLGLTGEQCMSDAGLKVGVQGDLQSSPQLDTIVIPGGAGMNRPGTREAIADWLLLHGRHLRRVGSMGTGIYPLAESGLLDRHEVTTDWRIASQVQREFPNLRVNHKRGLIKDGSFYSAAGLTSGSDLALLLVEEDYGKHVSLAISQKLMLYLDPRRISSYNTVPERSDAVDRFGELVTWMLRHLDEHLTVEVLAKEIGMCPAHFTRAFKAVFGITPAGFSKTSG
jgi:transcriptional regulator GlxA family with amidase domain